MNRLRVLLLAPDADPTRVSIPFVTYCHAAALAELHDERRVAGGQNPILTHDGPGTAIYNVAIMIINDALTSIFVNARL